MRNQESTNSNFKFTVVVHFMKNLENISFTNRESFRDWLESNHDKSSGIWMIFYKKHTEKGWITYKEALEEALCFGWIDSIVKKVDSESYVRKFTPRTNISNWSDVNKNLVIKLIKNGKMTDAGLRKIDIYLKTGKVEWDTKSIADDKKELQIPDYIINEFAQNEPALTNFNNLPKSHKRYYVLWITSAKKEETILNRLKKSTELLKENKRLGI